MVEIPTEKIRQKEISFITNNFDFVKCKKIGKIVKCVLQITQWGCKMYKM